MLSKDVEVESSVKLISEFDVKVVTLITAKVSYEVFVPINGRYKIPSDTVNTDKAFL